MDDDVIRFTFSDPDYLFDMAAYYNCAALVGHYREIHGRLALGAWIEGDVLCVRLSPR